MDLLICFVAGNERDEVSDDNLLTLVPKHQGRDRQKLLREQNVLEEVFAIMKALTDQQVLKEVKAEEWQKLLQRCNALLRLSQYDYRKNQVGFQSFYLRRNFHVENYFGLLLCRNTLQINSVCCNRKSDWEYWPKKRSPPS